MSAKLLKNLASGKCFVTSRTSGTVRIYWMDSDRKLQHLDILPFEKSVDLLKHATVEQLRRSDSLKNAITKGWVAVS